MKRVVSFAFLVTLMASGPAFAQMRGLQASPQQNSNRIILAGQLGLGGEIEFEADGDSLKGDADTSFGGLIEFGAPLHDLLFLGVRVSYVSVAAEDGDDSIGFLSFYAVPKLRLPLDRAFELHGGVPLGVSIGFLPDSLDGLDVGPAFSWGIVAGGTFFVSENTALYGEAGLMNPATGIEGGGESGTISASQFTLIGGISINI